MLPHTFYRSRVALWVAMASLGCSTGPNALSDQRLCSVHRIPLVTVRGFEARPEVIVDPSAAEAAALRRYPYFIQSGRSLYRSVIEPVPTKLTYCPKCEAAAKCLRGLQRI